MITRKGGNYSDVLSLKATRHDSIWGFKSELQTNPMPFHLELLWGTFVPHRGCAMGQNKIVRVGKNSGPVLSRLWAKVYEIFGQRRQPFVLSNDLARLSISCFVQQIFAIKFRSPRETEEM